MRLLPVGIALSLAAACYADIITLKNGRTINGTYLGGTPRQIKVEVGDNIQTIDVGDVARIEFNGGGYTSSRDSSHDTPRDDGRPTLRRADSDSGSSSSSSSDSGYGSGSRTTGSRPVILQPDPNDSGSYPSSSGSSASSDDSRPTLKRSSSASSSDSSSSSSSDSGRPTLQRASSDSTSSDSSSSSDNSRPTLRRPSSDSASTSSSSSSSGDSDRPVLRRATPDASAAAPAQSPAPAPPAIIPAQTEFIVRMIDAVDSQTAKEGDVFKASVDQPIVIDGQTVVLGSADAQVKLVQAHESGKFTGKTELTLSLWSVTVNGKAVEIDTQNITKSSSSRGAQTAKVAGGAAAAGAVIGAIAGGGKGAAVGAGAGAAGGAAVEAVTKGQRVKVASETLLTFVLDKPVDTQSQGAAAVAQPASQPQPQVAQAAPPAPAPPTIKIGQSQDAVVAALGQPDSVDASGTKQVYVYKNVKVTFINGKVSAVE
jgi:hypothetical protein